MFWGGWADVGSLGLVGTGLGVVVAGSCGAAGVDGVGAAVDSGIAG